MKKAVLLNDTSSEAHHGCRLVVRNIKKNLQIKNIQLIDTNRVGKNWIANKKFLKSMSVADLVLVNGEGTIHHSQPTAKDLVKVAKYVKDNLSIPVVLINATYQENDSEIVESMKYYDLIFVRESLSKVELEKFEINSTVVPDMTLYSKFDLSQKKASKMVGVTDSVYRDLSELLYFLSKNNNYKYLPILTHPKYQSDDIKSILNYIKYQIKLGFKFLLYFIGFTMRYAPIRNLTFIKRGDDYMQLIANSEFLIIARYHSLCFALKTMTPFVALDSNSHKIKGLLKDIGIKQRTIDKKDLYLNNFKLDFDRDEINMISNYINSAPKKIEKMFEQINQLIQVKD